jgi:hypothetical protein
MQEILRNDETLVFDRMLYLHNYNRAVSIALAKPETPEHIQELYQNVLEANQPELEAVSEQVAELPAHRRFVLYQRVARRMINALSRLPEDDVTLAVYWQDYFAYLSAVVDAREDLADNPAA